MKQVIITGKPGVGKTTLLNKLKVCGFKVISCDEIVNDLYKVNHLGYNIIRNKLGASFVDKNGVSKQKLWEALTNNLLTIDDINKLIHPLINLKLQTSQFDFAECPIISSKYFNPKNFIIFKLNVDDQIAVKRIARKKGISESEAQKKINLFVDNIKNDVEFDTTHKINSTFINKIIKIYKILIQRK